MERGWGLRVRYGRKAWQPVDLLALARLFRSTVERTCDFARLFGCNTRCGTELNDRDGLAHIDALPVGVGMNDRDSLAHIDALRVGVGMDGRDSLARNDAAHVGIEEQGREDLADIDALRVEMKDPIGLADFDALHVEMKDGDGLADFDALRVGVWGNPSAAKRIPVPSS
jgi:hypothetical protein